ncbi:hypothetical protein ACFWN1_11230 [Streptomyces sp. NPDC058459]|uniref:hypothetical protein n=1 Tax=Streptomyces sp. NPDC058459 TaxID=3346508 RepID=UPI0036628FA5
MSRDDAAFPAALDCWTSTDWREYRERVGDGEGSAAAIDVINRRRQRPAWEATGTEATR